MAYEGLGSGLRSTQSMGVSIPDGNGFTLPMYPGASASLIPVPRVNEAVATPAAATNIPASWGADLTKALQSWGVIGTRDPKTGQLSDSWGGLALGLGQGLANGYFGMKQLDFAKQALKQSKDQFALNFGAQRQNINTALEDRQRARVASNTGAYQSVGDYMNEHRIG